MFTELRTLFRNNLNRVLYHWQLTADQNILGRISYFLPLISRGIWNNILYLLRRGLHLFLRRVSRLFLRRVSRLLYNLMMSLSVKLMHPLSYALLPWRKNVVYKNSVLHISYMVHIPYYTTRILRKQGMQADYLAVGGKSPWWNKCDYHFPRFWPPTPWGEFYFFWKVVAKYEVIHSHFGIMLSQSGWELPILKQIGRKIVIHYRGCEIRDPEKNMALHPELNICQVCDYNGSICRDGKKRVRLAEKYGDLFLVTTPDMKDFAPDAIHFPFFTPEIDYHKYKVQKNNPANKDEIKIVHVTNHPGIEGTQHIIEAIDQLKEKGYKINFVFLRGVTPERVLQEMSEADLTIGKIKMGYYANAQIESMFLGVPAMTYVRPEFMTDDLKNSGFIFTNLKELEKTIEYYLSHPDELEKKRRIARNSILRLHNNEQLGKELIKLYAKISTNDQ